MESGFNGDNFLELHTHTEDNDRLMPVPDDHAELALIAIEHGALIGLTHVAGSVVGSKLVLDDDRILPRLPMYGLFPVGSEIRGVRSIVDGILAKHGPGRWWSTGPAVGYLGAPEGARVCDINGEPHVWLVAYYFHDPVTA